MKSIARTALHTGMGFGIPIGFCAGVMYGILGGRSAGVSFGLKVGVTVGLLMAACSGLAFGLGIAGLFAVQRRLFSRVRQELTITLVAALAFGGVCYLGIWCYSNERSPWRSACFEDCELRDPCRLKGLYAAAIMNPLPSDGAIQQMITGPWWHSQPSFSSPFGLVSRLSVASNGDFVCHITIYNGRVFHTNSLEGHWQVEGGLLIDTITKADPPRQPVPSVCTNRIVRVNDRELVYQTRDDYVLFRKIKQVNK